MKLRIVHAQRQFLIDILVVESHRPTQRGTEIRVQVIRTPESPLPAFQVDIVHGIMRSFQVHPVLAMYAQGKNKMCRDPKQGPAVIQPRL